MNTRYCWESSYTSRELRSSGFKGYLGHFPAKAQKKQQNIPRKTFLIFSEMELSSSNFLKRNLFLYFPKRKLLLYLRIWNPAFFTPSSNIKRNLPGEKFLYIRKRKPPKKFLYFLKRKLFLCFRKRKP